MNAYERPHVRQLVQLVEERPSMRIIALLGPRQTGKTTVAHQACQMLGKSGYLCRYVALDNPTPAGSLDTIETVPVGAAPDREWLVEVWDHTRRAALRTERGLVLVLDEIHLVPGWSGVIKGLWDGDRQSKRPIHVVILGSAPWRMMTGLGESLTGRFEALPVTHWSVLEMAKAFDFTIDEFLFFGGYPGASSGGLGTDRLAAWRNHVVRSIVEPVIDKDIIGLTRVRKPALMRQLMDLAPHYSGQLMSYNKLLGQLQDAGNTTTVAKYLNLLSDAGLIAGLSRYTPAPHGGRASPPKLNVLNTALMTASSGYTFEEARADRSYWGRLVESAVGAHLYNTRGTATRLNFWRDPPHEIDFVISRGPRLLGIEVKSGKSRRQTGLKAFANRFRNAKTAVVGTGGIPLNEFLSLSADQWLEEI